MQTVNCYAASSCALRMSTRNHTQLDTHLQYALATPECQHPYEPHHYSNTSIHLHQAKSIHSKQASMVTQIVYDSIHPSETCKYEAGANSSLA